jgi:hypothetical protein
MCLLLECAENDTVCIEFLLDEFVFLAVSPDFCLSFSKCYSEF